ncbi:TolC family protein [Effusibacillus consociatus]|uniref:TolC family protein n=1 Tax=Effusibacillus consociatus TaxID=1117041 RepID=A0ABV9Q8Z9_9BACL
MNLFVFPALAITISQPLAFQQTTDLTLNQALQKGYESSYEMKKAVLEVEKAKADKAVADQMAQSIRIPSNNLPLATLETHLAKYANPKQAELRVKQSQLASNYAKLEVGFKVKKAYFDLAQTIEQLESAQFAQQWAERQLTITQKKYTAGIASKKEILEAETNLAKTKLSVFELEEEVKKTTWNLNELLGESEDKQYNLTNKILNGAVLITDKSLDEWVSIVKTHNPNYQQKQIALEIADIRINEISRHYSSVLNSYNTQESDLVSQDAELTKQLEELSKEDTEQAKRAIEEIKQKSAEIKDQIEQIKQQKQQSQQEEQVIKQAEIVAKQFAELELKNETGKIKRSVMEALSNYKIVNKNVEYTAKELEKAGKSLRIIQLQYENGLASSMDVENMRSALNKAKLDYSKSKYQLLLTKSQFELVVGRAIE